MYQFRHSNYVRNTGMVPEQEVADENGGCDHLPENGRCDHFFLFHHSKGPPGNPDGPALLVIR
jgi:hypothetical protein